MENEYRIVDKHVNAQSLIKITVNEKSKSITIEGNCEGFLTLSKILNEFSSENVKTNFCMEFPTKPFYFIISNFNNLVVLKNDELINNLK